MYEKLVMLLHYVMENWENQNILTSHIENSISQRKTQYGTVSNKFDERFAWQCLLFLTNVLRQ